MALSDTEVVQRAFAAFETRDVEALLAWVTDDVELRSAIIGGAEANVYRGHDEIRRWVEEGDELFDELGVVIDEVRAVGDLVLALGHIHARGGASGVAIDAPTGWVVAVRGERISRLDGYLDRDAAIEAAREASK